MPKIYFSSISNREREYLLRLLEEKKWFENANFTNVFFPKDKKEVELIIGWRRTELFKNKIRKLEKSWRKVEPEFFRVVKSYKRKKLLNKYKCHISQFGPEGKYRRPDFLFVRLRTKKDEKRILETIGHEILHLLLADFLKSKKASYSEREGIIDILIAQSELKKIFPHYKMQSVGKVNQKLLKEIL